MTKYMPRIVADSDNTQEGEVGKMDSHVGEEETPVEGMELQADDSCLKDSECSESSERQHQDKILVKWVESSEKDETEKHKDASDVKGPQKKDKILETLQRIDSDAEPGKTQEGEAGDSVASIELPQSLKAEKTTNEEILQAELDGKALNLEEVAVECRNQQDAKKITDDLRVKTEQLKPEKSELQTDVVEIFMALRNTNQEVDSSSEALKAKEGTDTYTMPASALQTLSAQNMLHKIEKTETLISQPMGLLTEQQDQSQLEARKSELERELDELQQESCRSQKEIDYLRDRHNELTGMIETAKTEHKEKVEVLKRDIDNYNEECEVIERCSRRWSGRMLKLEEECKQMKETAEPMIYSIKDAFLHLESEVVERFRNIQMRFFSCRNVLQIEKLALHHKNQRLAVENNKTERELQSMDLTVLELLEEGQKLEAELYDEERINRMLAILYSRNDDHEVQGGRVGDVVASGDICQSEEAEKSTDKEILQTLQDEEALNLEDVTVTSEKQQDSREIVNALISEAKQLEDDNRRLQISIDKISNMLIDTNLEVDNLNKVLKTMEGEGEFIRPALALQTSSVQGVLHETEEAETLISQPDVSLIQEQQDQSQLEAQNSDLEKEILEMQKQSSVNQKEIDELQVYGNVLIEMIETAKTSHGKKIEGTWRDIENCRQECKALEQCIQRWSDRGGTLEEELRQMKEIEMPTFHSFHDALLSLKLEVEEQFRTIKMRLSGCCEELEKQKKKLTMKRRENEECTTMNHEMKRELQNMGTGFLEALMEMEESENGLYDTERVKKMEEIAECEKMLEELKMRKKDLEQKMLALRAEKNESIGLLSLQYEYYVEGCCKLCQLIHSSRSTWDRLGQLLRQGKL